MKISYCKKCNMKIEWEMTLSYGHIICQCGEINLQDDVSDSLNDINYWKKLNRKNNIKRIKNKIKKNKIYENSINN